MFPSEILNIVNTDVSQEQMLASVVKTQWVWVFISLDRISEIQALHPP